MNKKPIYLVTLDELWARGKYNSAAAFGTKSDAQKHVKRLSGRDKIPAKLYCIVKYTFAEVL